MNLPDSVFESFFRGLADAVLIYDEQLTIQYANAAVRQLTGLDSQALPGKPASTVLPAYLLELTANRQTTGTLSLSRRMEFNLLREDGSEITVEVSFVRIEVDDRLHFAAVMRDITKRKKYEASLEGSEAELKALFAAITDTVAVLDRDGRYIKIAPTHPLTPLRLSNQIVGMSVRDLYPPEVARAFLDTIRQTLESKRPGNLEYELEIARERHTFSATVSPLTADSVYWVARDITERRRAEDALLLRQSQMETLINSLPALVYMKDLSGRYIVVNELYSKFLGKKPSQLAGKTDFDILTSPQAERLAAEDQLVIQTGKPLYVGEQEARFNGQTTALATRKVPIKNGQGEVIGIIGLSQDVTELKEAQTRLQEILELQNMIMNLSTRFINLPVENTDLEVQQSLAALGEFLKVDRASLVQYNLAEASLTNTHEWCRPGTDSQRERYHRLPLNRLTWWVQQIQEGNFIHLQSLEDIPPGEGDHVRHFLEDQGVCSIAAVPLRFGGMVSGFLSLETRQEQTHWSGEKIALLKISADIIANALERMRTDEQLRRSEARNRALLQTIPDSMLRLNRSGDILDFAAGDLPGPGWLEQGLKPGASLARLLPVQTARSLLERIQTALTTRQMQTMEFQLDDGSTSTYYEARLIISGEEEVTAIIRNVSERARLEQMKSDFINRATHELRTPITTSLLMINLLESASSPAEISQYTAILKNEIERQRLLVEDLLTVAKLDNNAYEMSDRPVQPEIILAGVIASEKVVADSRQVQLEARVQGPLPLVMGDERALQQVFTNLIDNAVKFTPPGGKVQIEAQTEGAQLLIKVQDTGIGIPPEDIPNLFTRFFRASNARSREVPGTGIGLYIVKSIVEKMGGQISVASQLEQGTTFSIRLPHLGGSRQEN